MSVNIGGRLVGPGARCMVVAELGQNHNGDVSHALRLIETAAQSGADAIKLQTRTPRLCIPKEHWAEPRTTPWGTLSYIDYRERLELPRDAYPGLIRRAVDLGLLWWSSPWDRPSLDFLVSLDPPALKIPSACLTDDELLVAARDTGLPVILSTGMSTAEEIDRAVFLLEPERLVLLHCKSAYPTPPEELNLRAIPTLQERYGLPVGFSDHAVGLWMSLCAVALGAVMIERHLTLDRSSWGTDQAASVEPHGLAKLIQQIRRFEQARGDGALGLSPSEGPVREKLRRVK